MSFKPWYYLLALLVLPPALLINLGMMPFIDDEGIRALVAQEMAWSGNFITPTLHGSFYYNKPPLWNWILGLSFQLHGGAGEWAARLPTVLSLLGFAATVFLLQRRHFGDKVAFLQALMLITCGRILLYESMLGLIDIAFSWAMYGLFMVVLHEGEGRRWGRLFAWSYVLMAVGFLFKGLPAIAFQGVTLVTYLALVGEWRRLFGWRHILGGLLGVALIGGYYAVYHQYNDLANVFSALFTESSKRTAANNGLGEVLLHLLLFPLEVIYHFLPWTLLLVYGLRRLAWKQLRARRYLWLSGALFLANLLPYWLSPDVFPRYLLMLLPLLFTVLTFWHEAAREGQSRWFWGLHYLLGGLLSALAVSAWLPLLLPQTASVPGLVGKTLATALPLAAITLLYWRDARHNLWWLALALLFVRLVLNWFALPDRYANDRGVACMEAAIKTGEHWAGRELAVFHESFMQPTTSFYLERAYGGIIPRTDSLQLRTGPFYIYNSLQYHPRLFSPPVDTFIARHDGTVYRIARLRTTNLDTIRAHTLAPPKTY